MSNEIEEFLRRAAQRRAAQAARQPAKMPSAPPPQAVDEVVEAVEVLPDEVPPTGAGVVAHVDQHLDSRKFAERASHLGELAGFADDSLQAHLHQTFDHKVGHLAETSHSVTADIPDLKSAAEQAAEPAEVAQTLLAMLHSPSNLRAAFVLNELLSRPVERW